MIPKGSIFAKGRGVRINEQQQMTKMNTQERIMNLKAEILQENVRLNV